MQSLKEILIKQPLSKLQHKGFCLKGLGVAILAIADYALFMSIKMYPLCYQVNKTTLLLC